MPISMYEILFTLLCRFFLFLFQNTIVQRGIKNKYVRCVRYIENTKENQSARVDKKPL